MPIPYRGIIQSRTMKFVVGPGKAMFYVHQSLLNHHRLFREERDDMNVVRISNVDAETFSGLVEFLYTGDYATAEPRIDVGNVSDDEAVVSVKNETPPSSHGDECEELDEATETEESVPEPAWSWDATEKKSKKKERKSRRNAEWMKDKPIPDPQPVPPPARFSPFKPSKTKPDPWQEFLQMPCGKPPVPENPQITPEHARTSPHLDYSPVFLCHAQLYTLAERYDLEGLRKLSLYKLHHTLEKFELLPQRVSDVTALMGYAYGDEEEGGRNMTELKKLVICYIGCKIDVCKAIREDEIFKSVMGGRNGASSDLLEQIMKRWE